MEKDNQGERFRITLFVGDMSDADGGQDLMPKEGYITVTFRQEAGITNRTEGGSDDWFFRTSRETHLTQIDEDMVYTVPRLIELSDYKGSRGDEITVFAKGFKNGTTAIFYRDADGDTMHDAGEGEICSTTVGGNDIAECTFTLANPPFMGGKEGNYINAVDGRNNRGSMSAQIDLEPSISITPKAGGPGDSINVQLVDLEEDDAVNRIQLARRHNLCNTVALCSGLMTGTNEAGSNGVLSFSFEIPSQDMGGNTIVAGIQDLKVWTSMGKDANTNLSVASGTLALSSTTVLANQRISISASGFTTSSRDTERAFIGRPHSSVNRHGCTGGNYGSVTLGNVVIPPNRINDDEGIEVTSGGTWSAPIDLPVNGTTTVEGTYQLKITDCRGGTASVALTFPKMEVTITPEEGGVGSEVVISGKNFPAENDHAPTSGYEVEVTYDAGDEMDDDDVDPDALGNWTLILEVPEDATIPSSNTVKVEFLDDNDSPVLQTKTHRIPQGTVAFDRNTGPENSALTISAKGFARYTSVDSIEFGDREITPLPKPSTDTNGNGEFSIRIPGSDPGIYIIRVQIDEVVATHTFTVISGSGASDASVETVLANVISAAALDRVFRFDNSTKSWEWYISDPAFSASNNLGGLSSGDLVYIKVTEDVTADILGASTTLTCTNAGTDTEDCWNLIAIP